MPAPPRPYHHSLSPALLLLIALFSLAPPGRAQTDADDNPHTSPLKRLQALRRQCYKEALPCIMFSNSVASFGCAQCNHDVRQAAVVEIDNREGLRLFTASRRSDRVVMIPEYVFFDRRTINFLQEANNIAALIVYPGSPPPLIPDKDSPITITEPPFPNFPVSAWSDDNLEPNQHYNFYPTISPLPVRNEFGTANAKHTLFPYNIFHVNTGVAERIRALSKRFSHDESVPQAIPPASNHSSITPRLILQSSGRMFACPSIPPKSSNSPAEIRELVSKVNSSTCLLNNTCLPIGGQSVWSSLGRLDPAVQSDQRNILAVTVPIDSIAFFNELALGASAEISSLAVLMAVAAALADFRKGPGKGLPMLRQPVFFAFNAQSWGYAGSDRFLLDLKSFECEREFNASNGESGCIEPFMPSLKFLDLREANISVLNIGQLVAPFDTGTQPNFNFFSLQRNVAENGEGSVFKALFDAFDRRLKVRAKPEPRITEGESDLVPLDSTMSFRRYYPNLRDVVTLAHYNDTIKNKLFHSIYDNQTLTDDREVDGVQIRPRGPLYQVANVIADAIAVFAFGDSADMVFDAVNNTIIDEVITCMTANWTRCNLAKEYLGPFYEVNVANAIPGNYPSSFFPKTRLSDRNPSGAAKNALLSAFFAFQNAYESDDSVSCDTVMDCRNFTERLNKGASNQSAVHSVFCSRKTCVASDTHSHNAYGTGIKATNKNQTAFDISPQPSPLEEFNGSNPRAGDWTESAWGTDLGLCGYILDTDRYGNAILGAGVGIFVLCVLLVSAIDWVAFRKKKDPEIDEELPMLSPTPTAPTVVPAPVTSAS